MGGERSIKGKSQELSGVWSLRLVENLARSPFRSEDLVKVKVLSSGWLLCFSDLQLEPQYLPLGFYYLCYSTSVRRHGGNMGSVDHGGVAV